jgi:prefoldin subunit 5
MREQLQRRLEELRAEYQKGQAAAEELEAKLSNVRSMMLRLSGAIQVLQEELDRDGGDRPADGAAAPTSLVPPSP